MLAFVCLTLLAADPTPVRLEYQPKDASARLGDDARDRLVAALAAEGFVLGEPSRLTLRIERVAGGFSLTASAGVRHNDLVMQPAEPFGAELVDELGNRLVALAGELLQQLPRAPERHGAPLLASVFLGAALRFPAVDPTVQFEGRLALGVVEPLVLAGATLAPGRGLTAWEVPLEAGVRVNIAVGVWRLVPEVLGGARVHLFAGTADAPEDGPRVDPVGTVAFLVLAPVGALHVGLRVSGEWSVARSHSLGATTLWQRGAPGLGLQVVIER
jgi:hypothetical protein